MATNKHVQVFKEMCQYCGERFEYDEPDADGLTGLEHNEVWTSRETQEDYCDSCIIANAQYCPDCDKYVSDDFRHNSGEKCPFCGGQTAEHI
jgi:rRNA maturation protein Nop10